MRLTPSPFAASLRWHREQAGLTQAALAARAGIGPQHVSDCERGRVLRPREPTLQALAAGLGVPAARLLEPPPLSEHSLPDMDPAAGGQAPAGPAAARGAVPVAPVRDEPRERPLLLPAAADAAEGGIPAPVVHHATGAGPQAPGAAVAGRGQRAVPGATPEALSGAEWRKAAKAELSSQHAAQRRGRVRRKPPGITGVAKMPPERGDSS